MVWIEKSAVTLYLILYHARATTMMPGPVPLDGDQKLSWIPSLLVQIRIYRACGGFCNVDMITEDKVRHDSS